MKYHIRAGILRNARTTVTVVFVVTLGLSLAPSAYADSSGVPAAVDVRGKAYDEVKLTKVTDFPGVAKTYPCLQKDMEQLESDRKEPGFVGTKVYVGEHASRDGGSVVVLLLNGSLYCGSHGCALSVYRKSGDHLPARSRAPRQSR